MESNHPTVGLPRPAGFEDRMGHQTPAAPGGESRLRRAPDPCYKRAVPRPPKTYLMLTALLLLLTFGASQASASRAPTKSESAAIKKGFFKLHAKSATKITKIRVSTADKRFSAVTYTKNVREPVRPSARAATVYKPPPVILKKTGSKWKGPAKPSSKAKKDFKVKAASSDVRITGALTATLTKAATCDAKTGSASIYDKARDIYFSVQFHGTGEGSYSGPGFYPALSVQSIAAIYTNKTGTLAYETGQPNDAFSPSGEIYVDRGWGFLSAGMARPPDEGGNYPLNVSIDGTWNCG
jgi:hypothetical protein